ncbi:MAG TPA: YgaP-like transmembrane domain [Vicinamibacterales bacterium]|nr:YgaP-like transmembrane domain [Vicinamibacterales bacterium]
MSDAERWVSVAVGAGLVAYGLSRPRRAGWLLAGFGALLVRRGASGHCHTYEALGITRWRFTGDQEIRRKQEVRRSGGR